MRTALRILGLSCLLAFGSVSPSAFAAAPIAFSLTDQDGRTVTEKAFSDRYALVFFGYTHCPDICPTTLYELSVLADALPAHLKRQLSMVFVTGDPQRDTPEVLKAYMSPFGDKIIGLSGPVQSVDALAWSLKAVVIRHGDGTGDYPVDHSTNYTLLHNGAIVTQIPNTLTTDEMVKRLGEMMKP
ncbi:protein SCO1/2 [Rhizobium sp. RU20A]|uniref:SCO family protein n=1 Tax=Rhizobium sp. RU20A TaxID=1907412 RepID=UPI000954C8ED|nr:SCO family protein [Rhizobium sp. RU20A]SIQ86606.1 protein SCO1/2 [Rhizobium sp. RU20A]